MSVHAEPVLLRRLPGERVRSLPGEARRRPGRAGGRPAVALAARAALIAGALALGPDAKAACDVTVVAAGASAGGSWVGGVWTPSASASTVLASEVAGRLASGPTTIRTACGAGAAPGNIAVNAAVTWADSVLTLSAAGDVTVDAELRGTGSASLVLEYGQGSPAAGNTSIYRINVPAVLPSNPAAPTTVANFTTKRGSDGSPAERAVPDCPVVGRGGVITTGCTFLKGSDLAALEIRYGTIVIEATEDTTSWIWVDGRTILGHSYFTDTYFPNVWACIDGQGALAYPNSKAQASYFDANGTITDLAGLESVTTTTRACKTWSNGPVLPLFSSADFPYGHYVKFVPDPDETGVAYQVVPILFADLPEANTGYVVVDYVVNVAPDAPDPFALADRTGVPISTVVESAPVTVSGLVQSAAVTVTGGEYELNGDGSWTAAAGSVANGDVVRVRHTSSASYLTATDTTLTIGGVSDTFTSTTLAAPVDGACGPAAGVATAFVPTTGLCSAGTASGVANASPWSWACTGSGGGASAACTAPGQALPGGSGLGRAVVSGGSWAVDREASGGFVPTSGHPKSPPDLPAGFAFPYDLFDFTLAGGAAGSAATITITYPGPVPDGAVYWKYGPTPGNPAPHWYVFPNVVLSGTTATLTIVDGGLGDDDLAANGVIVDQGGPGAGGDAATIPALSGWGLTLLAGVLALSGALVVRRGA